MRSQWRPITVDPEFNVTLCITRFLLSEHGLGTGNVFEPRGLDELIPDWKERGAPVASPVTEDSFSFLTETKAFKIPNFLLPSQLVRWLPVDPRRTGMRVGVITLVVKVWVGPILSKITETTVVRNWKNRGCSFNNQRQRFAQQNRRQMQRMLLLLHDAAVPAIPTGC